MIEPRGEKIYIGRQELRRGVLSKSSSHAGRVGQVHQLQIRFDARIHLDGPNRASGGVRDNTLAGLRVGIEINLHLVQAIPHRFITSHEVGFSFPNRSAQSESKLVAFKRRRIGAVVKKVSSVEFAITKVLEKRAVKFVGSGAGDGVQNAAVATSVFWPVVCA